MLPNFFYGDGSLGMQLLQFAGPKIQRYKTGNSLNLQNVHFIFWFFWCLSLIFFGLTYHCSELTVKVNVSFSPATTSVSGSGAVNFTVKERRNCREDSFCAR